MTTNKKKNYVIAVKKGIIGRPDLEEVMKGNWGKTK